ncbi:FMN reductase [Schumannella luteola]|uniref:FMN reductase n=1 Tax=Schumannella luteola TaxID=472059 RepID=A0A852YKA0_9MICO|nr:FMN reductase [Schumannella luteola]NYG97625.1 FMN reductase [Schumannella luteola]TPX04678.1 FMN reductase [Schumannella luteola]
MSGLKIVAVSGSPTAPSRTTALVDDVARNVAEQVDGEARLIELAPLLGGLGAAVWRDQLDPVVQEALDAVEQADVLVVGSPAYRASYTGLFKLFFDHIGQYALVDKPVLLTATGGSDRHALLVEHQMRPLFGFFQAHTLPLGIFASEADFENYQVTSADLRARIDLSIRRALPFIRAGAADRDALAGASRADAF